MKTRENVQRPTPNAQRRIKGRPKCVHLRVNIRGIVRAYDPNRRSRTLSGQCQDCMREVQREITELENKLGTRQTEWRPA